MYRKVRKIPTIFGILIIMLTISGALYLDGTYQNIVSEATGQPSPADVHLTNITDNSITVSYMTERAVIGSVRVDGPDRSGVVFDDLYMGGKPQPRSSHMITVKNLNPDSVYKIKIINGMARCRDNRCPTFIQKTGIKLDSIIDLPPVTGQVVDSDNRPVEEAIVY